MIHMALQGIVALAAFSQLLRMNGQINTAEYYENLNRNFITYWMSDASNSRVRFALYMMYHIEIQQTIRPKHGSH